MAQISLNLNGMALDKVDVNRDILLSDINAALD